MWAGPEYLGCGLTIKKQIGRAVKTKMRYSTIHGDANTDELWNQSPDPWLSTAQQYLHERLYEVYFACGGATLRLENP